MQTNPYFLAKLYDKVDLPDPGGPRTRILAALFGAFGLILNRTNLAISSRGSELSLLEST